MPGVIDQTSFGFSREVGKMAFLHDDITSIMNFSSVEEFADKLLAEDLDILSPPPSSSSSPSRDNIDGEFEGLPDFAENTVDLLNFMDNDTDTHLPGLSLSCDGDCALGTKRILKVVSCSNKDPFMGHREDFTQFISSTDSPLGSASILGERLRDPLLDDPSQHHHRQPIKTEFRAWGHAPSTDDDEPILFPGNTSCSSSTSSAYSDDQDQDMLPDTPTSYSGTATGDEIESDVDIETIPDTPHSLDICGYSSSDTSSDVSISPTPLKSSNKISILQRYTSHQRHNSSSSKSIIQFNSCGVSSSVSLAENLMSGRSSMGKKRKHHKEKYSVSKSSHINSYNTYYPTGNSVNFHDYAMSPSSCMSTETAQPTVLSSNSNSMSKRNYKRKQLNTNDLSDKEKQNHHNQLERNRRQKLADLFIDLRDEVPSITSHSKASKVMILNQATNYIGELQRLYRKQEDSLAKELHRKEFLKKQLKQLELQVSRN